jgi:hypothetical protein
MGVHLSYDKYICECKSIKKMAKSGSHFIAIQQRKYGKGQPEKFSQFTEHYSQKSPES